MLLLLYYVLCINELFKNSLIVSIFSHLHSWNNFSWW